MAFSVLTPTGDGSTTQFSVNFPNGIYDRDNVTVYVGDEVSPRNITWISDSLIDVGAPAPGLGVTVRIIRAMNLNQADVNFTDGQLLLEEVLDQVVSQILNISQEIMDGYRIPQFNIDVSWNGKRITDLGPAVDPKDAVNYEQANAIVAGSGSSITSTADIETFSGVNGQSLYTFSSIDYIPNINAIMVFVDGVYKQTIVDYDETSGTSITFTSPLVGGEAVVVIGVRFSADHLYDEILTLRNEAAGYADDASQEVVNAQTEVSNAAKKALEAAHWANNPEDSLVPEGDLVDDYSALHWARKSEAAAGYKLTVVEIAASYQLQLADAGALVRSVAATPIGVTIPDNATVPFEVGTVINIRQAGAGSVNAYAPPGVTLNAAEGTKTDGEDYSLAIVKVGTDEWDLVKSFSGVGADQFAASINPRVETTGSQTLPSGLILKWGTTVLGTDSATVVFSEEFPGICIHAGLTNYWDGQDAIQERMAFLSGYTKTGINVVRKWVGDSDGHNVSIKFSWYALGV